MPTFQQRRDTILSQFAQAKADLETLESFCSYKNASIVEANE